MVGRSGLLAAILALTACFAGGCLAEPVDTPAVPSAPAPADEVTVYLTSGPIHSDLIIPRSAFANASPLMRRVVDNAKGGPWIIFGWGPYWFGRETKGGPYHHQPILGINAIYTTLIPQRTSRLRVAALDEPGPAPLEKSMAMLAIRMTHEGLQRAIDRIAATIETAPDGSPELGEQGGVAPGVVMYRSLEIYHATHECNHWVSEVLRAGGVGDSTVLDLVPESLNLDLIARGATRVSKADIARAVADEDAREEARDDPPAPVAAALPPR